MMGELTLRTKSRACQLSCKASGSSEFSKRHVRTFNHKVISKKDWINGSSGTSLTIGITMAVSRNIIVRIIVVVYVTMLPLLIGGPLRQSYQPRSWIY